MPFAIRQYELPSQEGVTSYDVVEGTMRRVALL